MFTLESKVIHGRGKGKKLGFATANQDVSGVLQFPQLGVYASKVWIDDQEYIGVTNIGYRPTVDDEKDITVETNIIGLDEDLYGKTIKVQCVYYLRGLVKFESFEQLLQQINHDKQTAKELFLEEK